MYMYLFITLFYTRFIIHKCTANESIKTIITRTNSDFLKLLPISRENLRKTDPCLGRFASQSDPSEWHTGTMIDRSAPRGRIVPNANYSRTLT